MMLRLLMVRHCKTEWNTQHRYQGQSDVPLSDVGRQQARALFERLAPEAIDVAYISDLKRAVETAEIILSGRDVPILREPRLREMNFGVLEGLMFDDAYARYPAEVDAWLKDYNMPPPGGEKLEAFTARITSFMSAVQLKHDGQTVLLVAHGGSLSELIRLILDIPFARRWAFTMDTASFSELQFHGGYPYVKCWNDTSHLK